MRALFPSLPTSSFCSIPTAVSVVLLTILCLGFYPTTAGHRTYPSADSQQKWSREFFVRGMNSRVLALVEYRNELVASGYFVNATDADARRIARWDGDSWRSLSTGLDGRVRTLLTHNDLLYVGGVFTEAGEIPAQNIAVWDGVSWDSLGTGFSNPVEDMVFFEGTLTVVTGAWVYQWRDNVWQKLGERPRYVADGPKALVVAGNTLVMGGLRTSIDPVIRGVAFWDGTVWSPLGDNLLGKVKTLTVHDGRIIAGGNLTVDGASSLVAEWTGDSWHPLGGDGLISSVHLGGVLKLSTFDGHLVAGGEFSDSYGDPMNLARWTGTSWEEIGPLAEGHVESLIEFQKKLIVGGDFQRVGTPSEFILAYNIAAWDGLHWSDLAPRDGLGFDGDLEALTIFNGEVVAAGRFNTAGSMVTPGIVSLTASGWAPFDSGLNSLVTDLTSFRGDLVAVGYFRTSRFFALNRVARWDGQLWRPLGEGMTDYALLACTVFEDKLIVGGFIDQAGTISASRVASWDGTQWTALGTGVGSVHEWVRSLLVHDGKLIVGGRFNRAGEVDTENVAAWDGEAWLALGSGLPGSVYTLKSFREELYAGGLFPDPSDGTYYGLARWDGFSWHYLGEIAGDLPNGPRVGALEVYEDKLVVGGTFESIGTTEANSLAIYDGTSWTRFGSGDTFAGIGFVVSSIVADLLAHERNLYVAGQFMQLDGVPSHSLARWGALDFVPVQLALFTASRREGHSIVEWKIAGEPSDHLGFHLYRQESEEDRIQLTQRLLTGQERYEYVDPTVPPGHVEYWLAEVSRTGEITWHGPAVLPPASLPARLTLGPGVPNPFRSQTQITYSIPGSKHVELVIYDIQGRRIATLVDQEQGPGEYTVSWDGRMDTGMAASGLYFLRLRAGKATKTQKLMFVR